MWHWQVSIVLGTALATTACGALPTGLPGNAGPGDTTTGGSTTSGTTTGGSTTGDSTTGDSTTGGARGGTTGGIANVVGTDATGPPTHLAEQASCEPLVADMCDTGLLCLSLGSRAYCVRPCTLPGGETCDASQVCVINPQSSDASAGYCSAAVPHYDVCNDLHACGRNALCLANATAAATRCVPICEVGTLAGHTAVTQCPPLPAGLGGQATACVLSTVGSVNASLCVADVMVGALCDQAALRCNVGGTRPSTGPGTVPLYAGGPSAGALSCLPHGSLSTCMRVCSTDGGTTQASCLCPTTDAACTDPHDAGVGWACVGWSGLAAALTACAPSERCDEARVCDDNMQTGLTHCGPTPYTSGSALLCIAP